MLIRTLSDLTLDRFTLDKMSLGKMTLDKPPFISGIGGIDQYTKLMLHMNGTNGSTVFTDSSLTPKDVTANGNAQISTAQSVFGGASGLFDGSGDYLTIPSSTDFDFADGDFTIDFWCYLLSSASGWFITRRDTAVPWSPFGLLLNSGKLRMVYTSTTTSYDIDVTGTATISTGAWHHIAFVRNGSSFKTYIDGVLDGSGTSTTTMRTLNEKLVIGASSADGTTPNLNGYPDELRISNVARWTSNFTPPTAEYTT